LLEEPWETTQAAFLAAWENRPWRAEPLHQISRVFRLNGHPRLAYIYASQAAKIGFPEHDILFLASDIYDWMVLDELCSTAFYAGQLDEGLDACNKLLASGKVPKDQLDRISNNRDMYISAIKQRNVQMMEAKKNAQDLQEKYGFAEKPPKKTYKKKKKK